MRPSTSLNVFFDTNYTINIVEQMKRVTSAGFDRLDMNFWDWSNDARSPFMQDNWKEWVLSIKKVILNIGAKFTQAHAHVYNFYEYNNDNQHEEQIRRSIIGAGMLEIPWVVLHPSQRPDWKDKNSYKRMIYENAQYFSSLAELADEWNTGLALENMSSESKGLTSAEQLIELIDSINLKNVGACWDTGHANLSGQNQSKSISMLGKKLHALHIADNSGQKDEHIMPFLGSIDWKPVSDALKEIGYEGDFTFEAHNIVRLMPESCKNTALHLLYKVGMELSGNN